jgi:hypothetical protein
MVVLSISVNNISAQPLPTPISNDLFISHNTTSVDLINEDVSRTLIKQELVNSEEPKTATIKQELLNSKGLDPRATESNLITDKAEEAEGVSINIRIDVGITSHPSSRNEHTSTPDIIWERVTDPEPACVFLRCPPSELA